MWRMDSLSVGISILRCWAKGEGARLQTVSGARLLSSPPIIIAGNCDHDRLEIVITILWNE